ncbi:MAG: hypothetical protein IPM29_04850 [Planctomycetes bacterium]|nr:hypothetical protein [Planctomycetota bacterium]
METGRMSRFAVALRSCALLTIGTLGACGDGDRTPPVAGGSDAAGVAVAIVASASATIDASGGVLALASGVTIEFPAGAVADAVAVTARQTEPTWRERAGDAHVVELELDGDRTKFARELTIRIPLPPERDDLVWATAGYVDADGWTVVEPCTIEADDGGRRIVATTDHFSKHSFTCSAAPPGTVSPLDVPYYCQGPTPHCWAGAAQMLSRAVVPGELGVFDFVGRAGSAQGLSPHDIGAGSTMTKLLSDRTGLAPHATLWRADALSLFNWGDLSMNNLLAYLRTQLSLGRPVLISPARASHAWVLIGYDDGVSFIAHNSQEGSICGMSNKRVTLKQLALDGATPFADSYATVVFADPLSAARPRVSVNLPTRSLWFVSASGDRMVFDWDAAASVGHSFQPTSGGVGAPTRSIPPDMDFLQFGATPPDQSPIGGIELHNASRTDRAVVDVVVKITASNGDLLYEHGQNAIAVDPNRCLRVFSTIELAPFRPKLNEPALVCEALVEVRRDGRREDAVKFGFTLDPLQDIRIAGTWQGKTDFGGETLTLTVDRMVGKDFEGSYVMGDKIHVYGRWDAAAPGWEIVLVPAPRDRPEGYDASSGPAFTTLLIEPNDRLHMLAPPVVLRRQR